MSIRLVDLFEETKNKYELQLIAGKGGLERSLNWVYVAEDHTNENFLRAGELIISTGVLYDHTEQWLLEFIHMLSEHHTCGLILNIGKHLFLSDITDNIINFCNRHNFPLLVMPWHIHIYDITRDYYNKIFSDIRLGERNNFFKLLLEIENTSVLDSFVKQKLGAVLDYDEKRDTNLSETLFLYLKHWGSVQTIASESYCHRNTITNRIHVLKEQLGFRLDDPTERFELMAAFMIIEFNKLQKRT
ncbi:MAG: PucR family transcriptional regulator [Lachnospiraceae bacterium]|nr:PucR family transcriptional regulator [Lachnospiraceae bacterium]